MVPDLPALDIPGIFAAALVEFKLTPEDANMRLLSMDWDIASVRRNAVESLSTRFVSGAFSRSTFPLWSRIWVKNTGFV